jgi:dipeptidase E
MAPGILLLTSASFSSPVIAEKFKSIVQGYTNQSIAIITTAAEHKEHNEYSQLARTMMLDMGFSHIDFVDLETEPTKDLSIYSVLYVCGGNTFKLLKYAQAADFKTSVEHLLARGGLYFGVSAGSIIVGPHINIAAEVEPDVNDIGLEDLTGLGITDLIISPHHKPHMEEETLAFEKKYGVHVERLTDAQAVLIQGGKKVVIE